MDNRSNRSSGKQPSRLVTIILAIVAVLLLSFVAQRLLGAALGVLWTLLRIGCVAALLYVLYAKFIKK